MNKKIKTKFGNGEAKGEKGRSNVLLSYKSSSRIDVVKRPEMKKSLLVKCGDIWYLKGILLLI